MTGSDTRAALAARVVLLAALLPAAAGCGPQPAASSSPAHPVKRSNDGSDWFVDRATDTALAAVHVNGMSGAFYFPEMMGPGVALFDYDNDGDLDVYFVQGTTLGPAAGTNAGVPSHAKRGDRLFRNDLRRAGDGSPVLRFTDVTPSSGIEGDGYGMGVATGDVDNDGCIDLYLTRYGSSRLLRNQCDGTFADITARSATGHDGWSVSATFADFDRDGWLDLYVGDYVTYDVRSATDCFTPSGKRDYCSPGAFRPRRGRLFRNNRQGRFADVTARSGLAAADGPGLGATAADFNADGWPDLYVANDGAENQLWINQRDFRFANTALLAGVAVNGAGRPEASMGVEAGDIDADGDEDLVIANLTGEGHTVYVNDGTGIFEDAGTRSGVRSASLPFTGFGLGLIDADGDGHLDLFVLNGAVRVVEALAQAGDPHPLGQGKQLFRNAGDGRFEDVTARAGRALGALDVGRGAAFGDIDNDGDVDVVAAINHGPLRLFVNTHQLESRWLGLRLRGEKTPRDMIGTRVAVRRTDGTVLWRRAHTDGSYASAGDPRVLVGLGPHEATEVAVHWPGGRIERWPPPPSGQYTTLVEGTGR